MLGGKSVNGNPVLFPREDASPYHIYHKVLNAKYFGVPQNRERVFIIGIRDDQDNNFSFPKPFHLTKRLKDVLESDVGAKYYLSDKMIKGFINKPTPGFENRFKPLDIDAKNANTITTNNGSRISDNFIKDSGYIKVNSATSKGYEEARQGDSINLSQPNSETRRGRVGKQVAQTLDTACNQAVMVDKIRRLTPRECFRLMDFPDTFKWPVSDTQAYKQAGNSIVVNVLAQIINKLKIEKI